VPLVFKIILNTTYILEYDGLMKLNVIFVILIAFLNKGIYFIYIYNAAYQLGIYQKFPKLFKQSCIAYVFKYIATLFTHAFIILYV